MNSDQPEVTLTTTAAPKYGEPTPDPLDEAWREFILTVGHALHLDRVVAWLSRRLGAEDGT